MKTILQASAVLILAAGAARADGFADFMAGICGTADACAQAMMRAQADALAHPPEAAPAAVRAVQTSLFPEQRSHLRDLANYVCRENKALLQSDGQRFIVQGGALAKGKDCPSAPIVLESVSVGSQVMGGLEYGFELAADGSIKAYAISYYPPTPGVTGALPQTMSMPLEGKGSQDALAKALDVWMKYPVPGR
jgi:hypothetical protein